MQKVCTNVKRHFFKIVIGTGLFYLLLSLSDRQGVTMMNVLSDQTTLNDFSFLGLWECSKVVSSSTWLDYGSIRKVSFLNCFYCKQYIVFFCGGGRFLPTIIPISKYKVI